MFSMLLGLFILSSVAARGESELCGTVAPPPLYVVGTADSVFIREVFFIQSGPYREVPLYISVLTTEPSCWLCTCDELSRMYHVQYVAGFIHFVECCCLW